MTNVRDAAVRPLAERPAPDALELLDASSALLDRLERLGEVGVETVLDAIVEVLGADRGALFLAEGGVEVLLHARHPEGPLPRAEWEEISRTVVRHALDRGHEVAWDAFAGGPEGSMADVGIVAAAAAPVIALGGEVRGVLYVDVRRPGALLVAEHARFVRFAASLVARALQVERTVERALPPPTGLTVAPIPLLELLASSHLGEVSEAVDVALASPLNVLIRGPSGSGKTELAMALASALRREPIVRATLGSSDDLNTITSELFGHERGAFSGAVGRRAGLVQHANGGTLILDEVLNLPPHAQQLLLDLTQFGTYRPLGFDGPRPKSADVRILAVTQGDLEKAIEEGRFRRDLYYRLAGIELTMPALADRRTDLPTLAEAQLRRLDPSRPWHLALGVRRLLTRGTHAWAGNLRELEAVFARARHRALVRMPSTDVILPADLGGALGPVPEITTETRVETAEPSIEAAWASLERDRERLGAREAAVLTALLREEGGVVSRAARRLGIPRSTLVHRMQTLGVAAEG